MDDFQGLVGGKVRWGVRQVRHLPRAWRLVLAAAGGWTLLWLALLAAQGLLPTATVLLTRSLVDRLTAVAGGGVAQDLGAVLAAALGLGAVLVLIEALGAAGRWVAAWQAGLVRDHLSERIQRRSVRVDLAFYEQSEFFDRQHRARLGAQQRPIALLQSTGALLQHGLTLAAMAAVLSSYGLWLPLVLLLSTLPAVAAALRLELREYLWRRGTTEDERRAGYLDWLLGAREAAAEMRLLGLGEHFRAAYQRLRRRLRGERTRLDRDRAVLEVAAAVVALLAVAATMAWMVWRLLHGAATLGDLALFYQAFHQGQRMMRSLLENVGQVYAHLFDLEDLFDFLDLEPRVSDPEDPAPAPREIHREVRFRGVTFTYPSRSEPVLEGFDLVLPAGRISAVIGPNGAGKSTLTKLLCRLYDPQSGVVEIDGVDLRRFRVRELRRAISVLFQEPVRYSASAGENIAYGDLAATPEAVAAATRAAGAAAVVADLPRGAETLLGSWFAGGSELSVGQWQRLALARAFLRRAPLILLDEPTSAMDVWAEADWLRRFRELAAGRTALLITHRLTTAMQADRIHLLDGGRVAESGSHQELLALGGRYAESWQRQNEPAG